MLPEALHVAIILSPFGLLPAVGWLGSAGGRARLLALIPAALTAYFAFAVERRADATRPGVRALWERFSQAVGGLFQAARPGRTRA